VIRRIKRTLQLLKIMKIKPIITHIGVGLLAIAGLSSCQTTYDAYGRPVQSVDPAAAVAGAAAVGIAAYAVGQHNSHKHHHKTYYDPHHHHYYPPRPHRPHYPHYPHRW